MKLAKHLSLVVLLVAAGIQFIRPSRTNPPAANPLAIEDAQVESILRRSCFDCHSNETRWPWYSEVAPISWQVAEHVEHGREHMNFSDWDATKAAKRLDEICEEIEEGEMPLWNYLLLHQDAKLSKDEVTALCSWSKGRLQRIGGHENEEEEHEH